jgi:energy-coupling factor transport system ATP-binding protein
VLLAAGFVVLRVVYRIVFGGADDGGIVLLDLPQIPLSGPFEDVTLLGAVTTGGIASAAVSALPFAAVVLAFGVLTAVVDIRALLARGAVRGPVRTVSRSLVVAWATFPALLESVRAVRLARALRGERSAASLVVPVLERTVERAIALGASMELRGFAATRMREPASATPAELRGVSLGLDGRWILRDLDMTFRASSLTLITGSTGSGKSTLLHSLSGVFQHVSDGEQLGRLEVGGIDRLSVPPRETAGFVGVVPQSVRLSFVAATVREELGFALAMRAVPAAEIRRRVAEVADRIGVTPLLDRQVGALSAGEACLVAIAAAVVGSPRLLLVDEPLADLDAAARERIVTVLDGLAHTEGVCVVVAEHALDGWGDACDARVELRDGFARTRPHAGPDEEPSPIGAEARGGRSIAEVRGLSVSHGDIRAVDDATFTLGGGEVVALAGPNGAGKSSLLLELARPSRAATVTVRDSDVFALGRRERRRAIALVPEALDDLLFTTTVLAECRRADRVNAGAGTADLFLALLGRGRASDDRLLLQRHPRDLSAGERLCLVLAIQLSARPAVLLVDEPSRGLDADARRLVGEALTATARHGVAVVIATHDLDFASRYSTRTLRIERGRVGAHAEVVR